MRKLHSILALFILVMLFGINLQPHIGRLPLHVDSWIGVSRADMFLDHKELSLREPFTGEITGYPIGSFAHLAVIASITGIEPVYLVQILPAIFLVILGLLLYLVSNIIFQNSTTAICVMAFTPLSLSNITMLGPHYLVPVTWGMLLSLLLFYFIALEDLISIFFIFAVIAATHSSTMVFAVILIGLSFIFHRRYWSKIKWLLLIILSAIAIFFFMVGYQTLKGFVIHFFMFEKLPPYINLYLMLPIVLIVLTALGFYFILVKEDRASTFLIPLFAVLALNAFLYWNWSGFLLVYRRIFTFLFLLMAFNVGYAIFFIGTALENMVGRYLDVIKRYNVVILIGLVVTVPIAVGANIEAKKNNYYYVNEDEHILFTGFGNKYPNKQVLTDHLQAFALPYYDLKPVQLSPSHGVGILVFEEAMPCYAVMDPECFGYLMYKNNITFVYSRINISTEYLKHGFRYRNNTIYQFLRKDFIEFLNNTNKDL